MAKLAEIELEEHDGGEEPQVHTAFEQQAGQRVVLRTWLPKHIHFKTLSRSQTPHARRDEKEDRPQRAPGFAAACERSFSYVLYDVLGFEQIGYFVLAFHLIEEVPN